MIWKRSRPPTLKPDDLKKKKMGYYIVFLLTTLGLIVVTKEKGTGEWCWES
jgi:hypothetical protein